MTQSIIKPEELNDLIPKISIPNEISKKTGLALPSVISSVELLEEGATIPFIARYRKDITGGLDEVQIGEINDLIISLNEFETRRNTMLNSICEQEKLTFAILSLFLEANTKTEIEDLYLPYKRKRVTRAAKAREKGLTPLCDIILGGSPLTRSFQDICSDFVNGDSVKTAEEAIAGASDIASEIISENVELREKLRKFYLSKGVLSSQVIKSKKETGATFSDYFDYNENVTKAASHRVLAVSRGEQQEILRVHIKVDEKEVLDIIKSFYSSKDNSLSLVMEEIRFDAFKRLLHPSMESETRRTIKKRADEESIKLFSVNLQQLLMKPPLGNKAVLALDPGFRTGCKLAILSKQGDFIYNKTIYPHAPRNHWILSKKIIGELTEKYSIEAIAIGSGTAGRETEKLVKETKKEGLIGKNIIIVRVDESGASIYSASPLAREEFPDLDITVRGAISIGRRLQDPLGELVKIDPKSIGVGQYQHDVDQTLLRNSLDKVVLSTVNLVGAELNTSSYSLLQYISGIGPKLAKSIVDYREKNGAYRSRKELLKVPRLGPKAYEQCAGFLRIHGAKNPLDSSAVHPESYSVVIEMAKNLNVDIDTLIGNKDLVNSINLNDYITDKVGKLTLKDIVDELLKPGRDPRKEFETVEFREDVLEFEDLSEGMILKGIVTNVTGFGAFVDIGVHQDGLVHVSELSHTFVKDPITVIKPGEQVSVKIMSIDEKRKRISLSIKALKEKPRHNKHNSHGRSKQSTNPFERHFRKK